MTGEFGLMGKPPQSLAHVVVNTLYIRPAPAVKQTLNAALLSVNLSKRRNIIYSAVLFYINTSSEEKNPALLQKRAVFLGV